MAGQPAASATPLATVLSPFKTTALGHYASPPPAFLPDATKVVPRLAHELGRASSRAAASWPNPNEASPDGLVALNSTVTQTRSRT
jgi:hypothetical protein